MRQSHSADFDTMKPSAYTDTAGRLSTDGADVIPITGRASLSRATWKSNGTMRVAFLLTCLQFSFAMYATFLLYWSSPAVPDLVVKPESDYWLPKIGKIFPQSGQTGSGGGAIQRMVLESGTTAALAVPGEPTKQAVCQSEEITFEQKKSNNTNMIEIKSGLFR